MRHACYIHTWLLWIRTRTHARKHEADIEETRAQDVPPFHVVAGNPARVIRKIKTNMDPGQSLQEAHRDTQGAERPMADMS